MGQAGSFARCDGRARALDGLTVIEAASEQEEATAIALVLREATETPELTAALVTPDRGLARRVSAELTRWGLMLDDSAGVPLAETAAGILFRLIAEAAAMNLAPGALAALIHHPLANFAMAPGESRRAARALELLALRGPRPAPGAAGLKRVVERACSSGTEGYLHPVVGRLGADGRDAALTLAGHIMDAFAPFDSLADGEPLRLADLVARHRKALAAVARRADGSCGAFEGAAGKALGDFLDEMDEAADTGLEMTLEEYPALIGVLMSGRTVRPPGPGHRRLMILGPLEARLLSIDRVVLGGLNEGTWPADIRTDPFLNRPMRQTVGLEAPERFIGLAAHDVAQLLAAPQVVLARAAKAGGAPTVASRWWQRLHAVAGEQAYSDCKGRGERYLRWARRIDRADTRDTPAEPLPRPSVSARPARLSVTEIERLIRDPYAVYAKRILGLHPLDDIDMAPDAAMRGSLIHEAMHRFDRVLAERNVADPVACLLAIGEDLFRGIADFPELAAVWWPRFVRVANWFAPLDASERAGLAQRLTEAQGSLDLDIAGRTFTLSGRADRIDVRADGTLRIVDYKTGNAPTRPQVESGLAPQLPLEAAMARAGGFEGLPGGREISGLTYVTLRGGLPPGEIRDIVPRDTTPDALAAATLDSLRHMLVRFADPATPYRAKAHVQQLRFATEYDHLSRFAEWSVADGEG
jgi:ATP-dependent helicase/nuclease subunit B